MLLLATLRHVNAIFHSNLCRLLFSKEYRNGSKWKTVRLRLSMLFFLSFQLQRKHQWICKHSNEKNKYRHPSFSNFLKEFYKLSHGHLSFSGVLDKQPSKRLTNHNTALPICTFWLVRRTKSLRYFGSGRCSWFSNKKFFPFTIFKRNSNLLDFDCPCFSFSLVSFPTIKFINILGRPQKYDKNFWT